MSRSRVFIPFPGGRQSPQSLQSSCVQVVDEKVDVVGVVVEVPKDVETIVEDSGTVVDEVDEGYVMVDIDVVEKGDVEGIENVGLVEEFAVDSIVVDPVAIVENVVEVTPVE